MTVREQLIELLTTDIPCDKGECHQCEFQYAEDDCVKHYAENIADFLLDNGVTIDLSLKSLNTIKSMTTMIEELIKEL